MVWFMMMMICMLYLSAKGDMDKDMICVDTCPVIDVSEADDASSRKILNTLCFRLVVVVLYSRRIEHLISSHLVTSHHWYYPHLVCIPSWGSSAFRDLRSTRPRLSKAAEKASRLSPTSVWTTPTIESAPPLCQSELGVRSPYRRPSSMSASAI